MKRVLLPMFLSSKVKSLRSFSSASVLAPLLLICAASSPAAASEEFPAALQEAAGMECTPSCTVCHEVDPGVSGTANKAFAEAMSLAGLVRTQPDTVAPAYGALPADLDSDGDGFLDKEELTPTSGDASSDPNNADSIPGEGPSICTAEILYGCGAQVASGKAQDSSAPWALLALALSAVAWRLGRARST